MDITNQETIEQMRQEDDRSSRRKSTIITFIFTVLVLVVLLFPFFYRLFPIPEAAGLMASFGNVEIAGGNADTPNPENNNVAKTTPTETKVEKVETNTNPDDPAIKTDNVKTNPNPNPQPNPNPNPQPNPNPTVNNNALFGGGGSGNNTGPGKQGAPDGVDDLGGTGRGDKGNGHGAIGNRGIVQKCPGVRYDSGAEEIGTAWVFICIDEGGKVVEANVVAKNNFGEPTTITSSSLRKLAVQCAKEYQYEPAKGQGQACGTIPIFFGKQ